MKLRLLLFLVVAIGISSCKEKEVQCHYSIFYDRGTFVAFTGFSQQELDTIIVRRYDTGSNFQNLHDTAITFADSNYRAHDTAYCDFANKDFFIYQQYDYEYFVKSTNSLFRINDIETGPTEGIRVGTGACSPGSGSAEVEPYTSIMINGVKQRPFGNAIRTYYVLLVK
ncbi:MAG: hypothetical protein ABI378_02100 [Chitinophagaceae bacterium]